MNDSYTIVIVPDRNINFLLYAPLAKEIGVNESIALIRFNDLIREKGAWRECAEHCARLENHSHQWLNLSISTAAKYFSLWSRATTGRIIKSLIDTRLLLTADFAIRSDDKSQWLALNFDRIQKLKSVTIAAISGGLALSQNEIAYLNMRQGSSQNETAEFYKNEGSGAPTVTNGNGNGQIDLFSTLSQNETERAVIYSSIHGSNKESLPELDINKSNITARPVSAQPAAKPRKEQYNGLNKPLDDYEIRFRKTVRLGFVEACGFKGRENLIDGKFEGQVSNGIKKLRADKPNWSAEQMKAAVIGFGIYWVKGLWWYGKESNRPKDILPPSPVTIYEGKNWLKFEKYCQEKLGGAVPVD